MLVKCISLIYAFSAILNFSICANYYKKYGEWCTLHKPNMTCSDDFLPCTACFSRISEKRERCREFDNFTAMVNGVPSDTTYLRTREICKNETLGFNSFPRLRNLISVSLKLCGWSVDLHGPVFDGLHMLESLHLNLYPMVPVTIEESLFKYLPSLRRLTLFPHSLPRSVENDRPLFVDLEKILAHLPLLEKFTFSGHYMPILVLADIPEMPNLHFVNLSDNGLEHIPYLPMFPNITYLDLSCNQIRDFIMSRWYSFTYNNLTLDLSRNLIHRIDDDQFTNYHVVKKINLIVRNSFITEFEENSFSYFTDHRQDIQLESLTIGCTPAIADGNFEVHTFKYLFKNLQNTSVEILDISDGIVRIENMETEFFSWLQIPSLTKLIMTRNSLNKIPPYAFAGIPNLLTLDLTDSDVNYIQSDAFQNLSNIQTIILSQNYINSAGLLNFFSKLPQTIKTLMINSIGTWKIAFGHITMTNAEVVDMSNVNFQSVSSKISFLVMPNIKELYLNDISCAFYNTKSPCLRFIMTLSIIRLEMRNCIPCIGSIKVIYKKTHRTLNMSNLKHLDISHNQIIEDLLWVLQIKMPALTTLVMSSVGMTNITEGMFSNFKKLESLDLSGNFLKSIGKGVFATLLFINQLKLNKNLLIFIDVQIFENKPHLESLSLLENKFECSCDLRPFRDWLKDNEYNLNQDLIDKCSWPAELKNTSLQNYETKWIDCDNHLIFVTLFPSIFVSVIIISVLLLAYFRLDIKYWYYFGKHRQAVYDQVNVEMQYDAFVCYNEKDSGWVKNTLKRELEDNPDHRFQLCIHERDFIPGMPISQNIAQSIESSRRTLFVMTRHFMNSEWGTFEIEMALMRLLELKKRFVIMIFLEKMPKEELKPKLRCFIRHLTYIEWPEDEGRARDIFWKRLKLAMLDNGEDQHGV